MEWQNYMWHIQRALYDACEAVTWAHVKIQCVIHSFAFKDHLLSWKLKHDKLIYQNCWFRNILATHSFLVAIDEDVKSLPLWNIQMAVPVCVPRNLSRGPGSQVPWPDSASGLRTFLPVSAVWQTVHGQDWRQVPPRGETLSFGRGILLWCLWQASQVPECSKVPLIPDAQQGGERSR